MQYRTEITINLPRERVIELFDSSENLEKWQEGLQSFEHISGEPGQVGAKSRLVYNTRGRTMEMIETITKRDFPDEFAGTYETAGVFNKLENYFYDEGETTRWVMENEFRFTNLMMRVVGFLMGRSFPKQTLKSMNDFKQFAESA